MSIGQKPLKGLAFYQQRGGGALVPRGARRWPILALTEPEFSSLPRRRGSGYIKEMRDLFDDLFRGEPIDSVEAARRASRPRLPRRFYRAAGVGEADGEFGLLLDGRPARTPARHPLAVPARALA